MKTCHAKDSNTCVRYAYRSIAIRSTYSSSVAGASQSIHRSVVDSAYACVSRVRHIELSSERITDKPARGVELGR